MTLVVEPNSLAFIAEKQPSSIQQSELITTHQLIPTVRIICAEYPMWVQSVAERLGNLIKLADGWGGASTLAPTQDAVSACIRSLTDFMPSTAPAPNVLPTPEGGLQLEWHCDGWDLEVEFFSDGSGEFWGEECRGSKEISGNISISRELKMLTQTLATFGAQSNE